MTLKDKILRTALRILNDEGLAQLKVERLTKELEISKGNLNYYFPKKEDIIITLLRDFNDKQQAIRDRINPEVSDIKAYHETVVELFSLRRKYRGLTFASASKSYPRQVMIEIDEQFKGRNKFIESFWSALYAQGLIKYLPDEEELKMVIDRLYLITNYWILMYEYHLSGEMGYKEAVRYFANLYMQELQYYVTEKGNEQLQEVLNMN